jgi:hypothetical protein
MKKYTATNHLAVASEDGAGNREGADGDEERVKIIARNSDNVAATDYYGGGNSGRSAGCRKCRREFQTIIISCQASRANTIPRFPRVLAKKAIAGARGY